MNPKVSIIVPIYKVPEQYMRKCIESLQQQSLNNIEIILVDDGTPDNCGAICDSYKSQDARIVVIHKANGGLAAARNTGVAVEFFSHARRIAHRDRRLDDHDSVWIVFHDQLNHSFNRRRIKVLGLAVIVSGLNTVRRSCSTVAYKAHLLPYVATYPLFRA